MGWNKSVVMKCSTHEGIKKSLTRKKLLGPPLVGCDLNKLFYIVETCLIDSYVLLISVIYLCFRPIDIGIDHVNILKS